MTLLEVIETLDKFDSESTIYACRPWKVDSTTTVCSEPESGVLPNDAVDLGAVYFLEISIIRDFVEDWLKAQAKEPTNLEICLRVIQYAQDDA